MHILIEPGGFMYSFMIIHQLIFKPQRWTRKQPSHSDYSIEKIELEHLAKRTDFRRERGQWTKNKSFIQIL